MIRDAEDEAWEVLTRGVPEAFGAIRIEEKMAATQDTFEEYKQLAYSSHMAEPSCAATNSSASNATISDLRNSLGGPSAAYRAKQLHQVPDAPVVVREEFILNRVSGKVVLDIGASGRMHEAICRAAEKCYGVDRPPEYNPMPNQPVRNGDDFGIDLDEEPWLVSQLPEVEIVVCGEVIEHLSNPGRFLRALRLKYRCPVVITVPNAFADAGRGSLDRGTENVNRDHVAWYSYRTLKTLLEREGYKIVEFYWYNGRPKFSEGMIAVVE